MTTSGTAPGRVIVVPSGKGGGTTTIATNPAAVLNAAGARRVCPIDLDVTSRRYRQFTAPAARRGPSPGSATARPHSTPHGSPRS